MNKSIFKFEKNSFDILRCVSALSVMFLHYTYYAITLSEEKIEFLRVIRRVTEFLPGVVILFSLSGFLISASFERCKSRKEFFVKRVFRLYPELWICTLVNLFVIVVQAREYLDKSIIIWLVTQVVGIANTPSCLDNFATGSINGALWTIFTEVQLYIFLGIMYPRIRKLKKTGWGFLLSASALINLLCNYVANSMGGIISKIIERTFLPYLIWFLIGIFCYCEREKIIPILKKYLWILIIIFGVNQIFGVFEYGYYEDIVTSITLPFITIGLAYVLPSVRIKCDLSYGIFLYHWIVLNVMVSMDMFASVSWYVCGIIFVIFTIVLAWGSWYFVGTRTGKIINKMIR